MGRKYLALTAAAILIAAVAFFVGKGFREPEPGTLPTESGVDLNDVQEPELSDNYFNWKTITRVYVFLFLYSRPNEQIMEKIKRDKQDKTTRDLGTVYIGAPVKEEDFQVIKTGCYGLSKTMSTEEEKIYHLKPGGITFAVSNRGRPIDGIEVAVRGSRLNYHEAFESYSHVDFDLTGYIKTQISPSPKGPWTEVDYYRYGRLAIRPLPEELRGHETLYVRFTEIKPLPEDVTIDELAFSVADA